MEITNITDDYDKISLCNCTDNEYNIDINIPALLFTIPCCLSLLFLISISAYTLINLYSTKNKTF